MGVDDTEASFRHQSQPWQYSTDLHSSMDTELNHDPSATGQWPSLVVAPAFEACVRVHSTAIPITVLVALLLTAQAARGECVKVPVHDVASRGSVRFVVGGTPTSITPIETRRGSSGFKVTFDVSWVWKGTPGQRIDLYVNLDVDNPQFAVRRPLIVFVGYMERESQRRLGISTTDGPVLTVFPCTDVWSEAEITAALGPGAAPRKERESSPSGISQARFTIPIAIPAEAGAAITTRQRQ